MSWIVICRPLPSEKISGLPQSIVESASGTIGSRCITSTINRLKAWSALKYLLLWGLWNYNVRFVRQKFNVTNLLAHDLGPSQRGSLPDVMGQAHVCAHITRVNWKAENILGPKTR